METKTYKTEILKQLGNGAFVVKFSAYQEKTVVMIVSKEDVESWGYEFKTTNDSFLRDDKELAIQNNRIGSFNVEKAEMCNIKGFRSAKSATDFDTDENGNKYFIYKNTYYKIISKKIA